ncbi:HIT family protein [Actinomadura sp. KC216]|uniref:HIT family protein n=1 Tax=Actinomadura sp. KC216 TaxID=2530370 RepID=UPI00105137C6|nr:HIT family protein [Actinomadura sp. KC216]TDB88503.1 HIT family protein [Actinomadura sp. KC216]
MDECTFCGIVAGRLPSHRVLEDEHTVAFLDIAPASPGHTLVVPREHAADVWTISEAAHAHVARMVHRVAALVKAALVPDGLNIVHSTGRAAWQEVFHFHTHVVPRLDGDDLRPMWSSEVAAGPDLERTLELIAAVR